MYESGHIKLNPTHRESLVFVPLYEKYLEWRKVKKSERREAEKRRDNRRYCLRLADKIGFSPILFKLLGKRNKK